MKYLLIIGGVAFLLSGLAIKVLYDRNSKLSGENAVMEAQIETQKKQAARHANRPRTDDDAVMRLCRWAEYVRRSEDQPRKRVPGGACQ